MDPSESVTAAMSPRAVGIGFLTVHVSEGLAAASPSYTVDQ